MGLRVASGNVEGNDADGGHDQTACKDVRSLHHARHITLAPDDRARGRKRRFSLCCWRDRRALTATLRRKGSSSGLRGGRRWARPPPYAATPPKESLRDRR